MPKLWAILQSAAGFAAETVSNRRAKQLLWQALIKVPGMLLSLPNSAVVVNTDSKIQDVDDAEKLGVQIVAPESLRESSLGMYDLRVCDARLSKEQRTVLECIAKSRFATTTAMLLPLRYLKHEASSVPFFEIILGLLSCVEFCSGS